MIKASYAVPEFNMVIVLRMQKRAARIILDAERTTRTLTMFNELNWIPFFIEAYISRCSNIAFKRIEGTTPDYFYIKDKFWDS